MCILVVDDEKHIRDSLSEILKMVGYDVITASDGTEAIKSIKKGGVNLMLLDLSMPDMGGEELINRLGRAGIMLPTLVITAMAPWKMIGLTGQGIGYLRKPVNNDLLLSSIRILLKKEQPYGFV